jgi:hypothetical protein
VKPDCIVLREGGKASQGQKPCRQLERCGCLEIFCFHFEDMAAAACRNPAECGNHFVK